MGGPPVRVTAPYSASLFFYHLIYRMCRAEYLSCLKKMCTIIHYSLERLAICFESVWVIFHTVTQSTYAS